jgi:hypothetical protein
VTSHRAIQKLAAKQLMEQFDSLILEFVRQSGDIGITRDEIHQRLHNLGAVGAALPSLRRLKATGRVEARGRHWIVRRDPVV